MWDDGAVISTCAPEPDTPGDTSPESAWVAPAPHVVAVDSDHDMFANEADALIKKYEMVTYTFPPPMTDREMLLAALRAPRRSFQ